MKAKKLILVLIISILMTGTNKETQKMILDRVFYIYYLVQFQKNKLLIQALINSGSKIDAMTLAYAKQLDFQISKTYVKA